MRFWPDYWKRRAALGNAEVGEEYKRVYQDGFEAGRKAGLEEAAQFCQDNAQDMATDLPDTLATTFRNMKENRPLGTELTKKESK